MRTILKNYPPLSASSHPGTDVHVDAGPLRLNGNLLFDRIRFRLDGGRTTCLVGPSGVGKSTLLRLVAGLEETPGGGATGGDATTGGTGAPLVGRIAYMAQQDLLLPWLSVLDNTLLGFRLRGRRVRLDDAQSRAAALLRRVGLGDRLADRPATLSGGMRQRVALIRTLMEDRPVVLMDEPFSALDAITRLDLQAMAAGMLAGRTVLLVTHDPLEALRLGHRLLVLRGRPARLVEMPVPDGHPPRSVTSPDLLAAQANLLARLAEAAASAATSVDATPRAVSVPTQTVWHTIGMGTQWDRAFPRLINRGKRAGESGVGKSGIGGPGAVA